jgi:DNA invertase Pin-like site-specific DNA recombinase
LQKDSDGKPVWTTKPTTESTYDHVVEMANLGMNQADITKELDVNKSTVCRHWNKAEDRGEIKEKTTRTPRKKTTAKRSDLDD